MISIVIPVYQCKNKISQLVEDLLKQTYQDYEVLLVDDGSLDDTGKRCQEYAEKDSRFHAVLKEHQGVSETRNAGISLAKGEYIAFVDSDDRIEPDYLEQLHNNINGYDLIISTFDRWFYQKNNRIKIVKNIELNAKIDMGINFSDYFSELYVSTLLGTPCCKLFRADIIKTHQIQFRKDIYIGEDFIFNFDYLSKCNKIRCIPYIGYHYICKNGNSLTHKKDLNKFEYGKNLFQESIRFSEKMQLSKQEAKGIYNLYLRTVFKNIELIYQVEPKMTKKDKKLYVERIVEDDCTKIALLNAAPDTKEFVIYKFILSTKSYAIIISFAKFRLLFKKIVGRT